MPKRLDAGHDVGDLIGRGRAAAPGAIAGMVRELDRVYRPDLVAQSLQGKGRSPIAHVAVGNMALKREKAHGRGHLATRRPAIIVRRVFGEPLDVTDRPSAPQRPLYAGRQHARAGEGQDPAGRCADLRPRGRRGARGQGSRAHQRRAGGREPRLRQARDRHPLQRARHAVGRGRHRGDRQVRRRCDPGAQGRERHAGDARRVAARYRGRADRHGGVGDDGDAQGHAARRGDRRRPSAARRCSSWAPTIW